MTQESEEKTKPGNEGPIGGAPESNEKSKNKQEKTKDHVILEEKHAALVRKNKETVKNFEAVIAENTELRRKLDDVEKVETEAGEPLDDSDLFGKVKGLEGRVNGLGKTLDEKNKEIKSLQAQLRKAKKFVSSPIQRH